MTIKEINVNEFDSFANKHVLGSFYQTSNYGKLKEKVRAIISLIIPLLVSAFQRSEELANAMEARGYNPGAKRTRYRLLKWHLNDTIAIILLAIFFAGVLYVSISHIDFVVIISSLIGG